MKRKIKVDVRRPQLVRDAELVEIEGAVRADVAFFQDEVQDAIAAFFSKKLKESAA